MSFDLTSYLAERRQLVDRHLGDALCRTGQPTRIVSAMCHSLMAGGKRLRPVLCIAAAEAVGAAADEVLPAACAIEMLHTYSLIHDDLPAMDDDRLRRGRPTCHVAFDEATAILAGDALLTLAFDTLARAGKRRPDNAGKWLSAISLLAGAAGHEGMIEGQMRDLDAEGRILSVEQLEAMHRLKTGRLIEASVVMGGLLGGGDDARLADLKRYAASLGLAFQVTDDLLNIEGDPRVMGKAAGTDAARKKSTYPALLGRDESRALARSLVDNALQSLEKFDSRSDPLRAVAGYVLHRTR